jgi:hypothetical protein
MQGWMIGEAEFVAKPGDEEVTGARAIVGFKRGCRVLAPRAEIPRMQSSAPDLTVVGQAQPVH